jgi:glucosamine--fructose-6-phosphate aminotransferase (isomerizing)
VVAGRIGNAGGVVIGYGERENFIASDLPALLPHTRTLVFLEHGDTARVRANEVKYTHNGVAIQRAPETISLDPLSAAKGSYKHFMQKEIAEQPEGILDTIRGRALFGDARVELDEVNLTREQIGRIRRVLLVGMGTSLHAAMVGRSFMERIAGIPAEYDNASELRYRKPLIGEDTLVVSVTQSGESVDTLAAMEEARRKGALLVAITNVPGSQASRMADGTVHTRCGLEIAVCSTKTYTASITALYLLACYLAQERGIADRERMAGYFEPLARLPNLAGEVLKLEPQIEQLAHRFWKCNNFLFLGRGLQFPVAMEGAIKLKEISYIHAEGYPAGEMKHGPIALIDRDMPVFALCPRDGLREKMMSNIEQVRTREGTVIAVGTEGDQELAEKAEDVIFVPEMSPLLTPVLTSIPLQMFAYHVAVRRGCDVDQPRNLAKTVTVE